MNSERLTKLFEYLKEEPDQPFHLYAIAMEYMKEDRIKAKEHLVTLLESHPNYLPTYYQLGFLYSELGEDSLATKVLEKGIALAEKQRNVNTLRELRSLYDELTF